MSPVEFARTYRQQTVTAFDTVDLAQVARAIDWFREARDSNKTIFVCGNGGSASTASHFVCDIVKGASYQKVRRFRMLSLSDAPATVLAYANDVGYQHVFSEPLTNFARAGDLLVCLSGSGNSPNVLRATTLANSLGCRTIALTGRDGGELGRLADLNIQVRESNMGRIEDSHFMIMHMICYYFMEDAEAG